jgi:hypothetical protein
MEELKVGQRIDIFKMLPEDRYKIHPVGSFRAGWLVENSNNLIAILGRYAYTQSDFLSPHIGQDVKKVGTMVIKKLR